jgi:hypothetical protein
MVSPADLTRALASIASPACCFMSIASLGLVQPVREASCVSPAIFEMPARALSNAIALLVMPVLVADAGAMPFPAFHERHPAPNCDPQ